MPCPILKSFKKHSTALVLAVITIFGRPRYFLDICSPFLKSPLAVSPRLPRGRSHQSLLRDSSLVQNCIVHRTIMFLYVYFFFSSSLSVAVSDFDFLLLAVNETRTFSRAMNVYRSNVLPECICRKREGKTKSGLEVQTSEGGGNSSLGASALLEKFSMGEWRPCFGCDGCNLLGRG